MFFKLFLLFSIVPALELVILVYASSKIGIPETLSIVIITAIAGAFLVRREGIDVLTRIQSEMNHGNFPANSLIDGALVLVSGALLLTPGFITDITGFLLVLPASRQIIKRVLMRLLQKHMERIRVDIKPPPN